MKNQRPEVRVGYVLLIIGAILIIIPVLAALLILLSLIPLPIYVPTPTVIGTDPNSQIARVLADGFPLFNIIPTFLLMIVMIYAGSILMAKGVGLVKEINWKIVQTSGRETNGNGNGKNADPAGPKTNGKKAKTTMQAGDE